MHFSLPGKSIIVLNSNEAAKELLDRRSVTYSDRPSFPSYQLCVHLYQSVLNTDCEGKASV